MQKLIVWVCGGTAEVDCAGACNGDAVEDQCVTCGGDAEVDCAGECGGEQKLMCRSMWWY